MKSAAFNLAFKVHRSEMPFAEGLLRAVESDAANDFIEALNSLAGEPKYDSARLQEMVVEAKREEKSNQDEKDESKLYETLELEIENLRAEREELKESVQTLEAQLTALTPTIVPGMNSLLVFIAGSVIAIVALLAGSPIFGLILVAVTLTAAGILYLQDMSVYNRQREDIERKKERAREDIGKIKAQINLVNIQLKEKRLKLQTLKNPPAAPGSAVEPLSSPEKRSTPDLSNDLPPLTGF